MTEKLRFVGTTPDAEFKLGEISALLVSIHQGFYELKQSSGEVCKYTRLAMLLKLWQPAASYPVTESDPNGATLADMRVALSQRQITNYLQWSRIYLIYFAF